MVQGLDYSAGRPSGAAIRDAGYSFVVRYCGMPGNNKNITRAEFEDLLAYHVDCWLVYEVGDDDALGGFEAGVGAARAARADADSIGYPRDGVIFFCSDRHLSPEQVPVAVRYLDGAASVLGRHAVGAYGFAEFIDAAKNGKATYFWQAGSRSLVGPGVHIYQRNDIATQVGGVACDVNELLVPIGAARPVPPPASGQHRFMTWGTDVRVHAAPSVHAAVVHVLPGPTPIQVASQVHAERVVADGYTNDAWAFVPEFGGFLSNIYIDNPAPWLPGVPEGRQPPSPAPAPAAPRPGAPAGQFTTWGTGVRVHTKPSVHSTVLHALAGPTPIHVVYQVHGEQVVADGYTNDAWSFVPELGGFLSNIYIDNPAPWLPGVPDGGQSPPPSPAPAPAPGPAPHPAAAPGRFTTWGHQVRVHTKPSAASTVVRVLDGPTPIHVAYQVHGERITADGYTNDAWSFVPELGGFLSDIYIHVPEPWLPGVPGGGGPAQAPPPGGQPSIGHLAAAQIENARVIIQTGERHAVPEQGLVIAIVTALQESSLRNLAPGQGDRDSVGLFQQRPSTGWGTPEQCHDPVLASEAFYGVAAHTNKRGLLQVPNWERMPVGQAAQDVQGSAFPGKYAPHEPLAREVVSKLK